MDCHWLPDRNTLDPRPYPPERAGIRTYDKSEVRFANPDSTYPVIEIDKFLFDEKGDTLPVGFYEVALSDDKSFLLLIQAKKLVAKIPVYLYEQKQTDEKTQKEVEKKRKKRAKYYEAFNAKLAAERFNIERVEQRLEVWAKFVDFDDDYYIIEYNRYGDKAYGAVPKS